MNRFIQLARLPATRLVFKKTIRTRVICRPALIPWQGRSFQTSVDWKASSSDWQSPPPANHPLIQQLQEHPHIMEELADFTELLTSKGVDVSGKKPSFMQIMKVMSDPEVKEKAQKLAQSMQSAGIQLDLQTVQELQGDLNNMAQQYQKDKANTEVEQEQEPAKEHGRKRGVMGRMRGLFKKSE